MATGISVTVTVQDDSGKTARTVFRLPSGFTLGAYIEMAQQGAQLIANMVTGRVINVGLCIGVDLAALGLKTVATVFSKIAHKMFIQMRTAAGTFTRLIIPAALESPQGTDIYDDAETDFAALITALEDGVSAGVGTVTFTDNREQDITQVKYAVEQFRRLKSG